MGVRRLTFSGGEPTLHRDLHELIVHARTVGLQTSIVTNGSRLTDAMLANLDLVGLSIDATDERLQGRIGRVLPGRAYVDHIVDTAHRAMMAGARVKLNTVVTQLNLAEDLSDLVVRIRPSKWKPMQFVHVAGENDATASVLAIDDAEFDAFVERHRRVRAAGIWVAPETAQTIRSTYVMVDPAGRLFQHTPGGHVRSRPILDVGLRKAMAAVGGYDRAAFEERGGHVDVRRLPVLGGVA